MEQLHNPALLERSFAPLRTALPWLDRYPWQLYRYVKQEYICHFREPVDRLFFLIEGAVTVSLTPPHGRTHIITYCPTGDLICGDVEVALGSTLASADLRVEEDCLCASIPIAPHRAALLADNDFLRYTMARLAQQMVQQSVYTANNLLFPLEARMAAYVLAYSVDGLFHTNLTRTAELLGVSYRQLSRVMRSFTERCLLEKLSDDWRIADAAGLRVLAEDIEPPL